jgi:DNA repair protein RadC
MDSTDGIRRKARGSPASGHRQRLRDKFFEYGLSAFTDAEILELLLSLGTPRQDCKGRAREALARFGSLSAVLEASLAKLQEVPGIGPKNAFAVKFIHEVAREFLKQRVRGKTYVNAADDVVDYLWHALGHRKREAFVVVFLDAQHGVIDMEELFVGTLNASAVYPREVVKRALQHHAAALVLAHNHPSGSVRPSSEDILITRRLYLAARLLDIAVLDHVIIGDTNSYCSLADEGLMEKIRTEALAALSGVTAS